jgi:epoxide hydrolase 4
LIANPFRLKLIPECGHWIQQEVPQLVNLELLSFLRDRATGSGDEHSIDFAPPGL